MTKFDRSQLVAFIRALDRNLGAKVKVVVIGGAAAAVGYGSRVSTSDIDVFNVLQGSIESLSDAAELARQETGLGVGIGAASIADLPYRYEDRLRLVRGLQLRKLLLLIPDKYDLALSKTVRGYPHDIAAVEGMNQNHRMSRKTLVDRFEAELMKEATTDRRKLLLNMAMVVARLYGFEEGRKLAVRWDVPVPAPAKR